MAKKKGKLVGPEGLMEIYGAWRRIVFFEMQSAKYLKLKEKL